MVSAETTNESASDDKRDRRREDLHEQPAEARPADVREGAAAVQKRAGLEVALPRHERDEERAVRDVEEHAQRADQEAGDVELPQRQQRRTQ